MPFNKAKAAILTVLPRLGIDPTERVWESDQDPEYTACRAEEIPQYFQLYLEGELSADERAVLCCFLFEGLNDFASNGDAHVLQDEIIDVLVATDEHAEEVAYWMCMSEPDPENWWPIAASVRHRVSAKAAQSH